MVTRESYEEGPYDDEEYFDDPNLDENVVRIGTSVVFGLVGGSVLGLERTSDVFSEDDSPYPEVRSAVANTDDPEMPASTFRAWFIGVICAIILPGLNQFMYFRWPSVTVGPVSSFLKRRGSASSLAYSTSSWPNFSRIPSVVYGPESCPGRPY